ncbi:MAG: hypothetical protein RRB13_03170 [bacterium]|nr:hypothetical protein [bacterium]
MIYGSLEIPQWIGKFRLKEQHVNDLGDTWSLLLRYAGGGEAITLKVLKHKGQESVDMYRGGGKPGKFDSLEAAFDQLRSEK